MNKTLSRFVILALLCLFYSQVYAIPAKPGFTSFTQSDGSTILVQALGDEFCHSLATSDGLIISLGADGDYYYQLPDGITNVRVHNVGERTVDELVFLTANRDNLTMSALIESRESKGKMRSRRAPAAPLRATQVPNNGSPRVPIILVQYTDKAMSNTKAQFVTHYTSLGAKSVRQYFVDQSNGLYDPQFDVYGIYTLPSNRATYGGNDSNGDDKGVAKMVGDAISKAGNDIDWSLYDNDHDGEADVCIVVYAGVGEAQAYQIVPNAVWPCQWNLTAGAYYGDGNGAVTRNGTKIDKFAVFNEVNGSNDNGTVMDGIGTFCHEFSHCLGLPDFYETTYRYGYYGMGGWSLMNSGSYNGINIDGDTPIGYSAYEKNFMGWIDYITPVENTYYTLPVFNSKSIENDQAVKITALNENEYWILENRKQQGWDQCIADEGVLITHFTYVADRWTANTVNNQSVQLATIIPADNRLTEATENADLYGESKHEFTTSSTPAMKANMSASGTLSSSTGGAGNVNKPVTEITLNNDGTASFWYIKGDTPSLAAPVLADASSVQRTSFVATWTHTPSVSCTYTLNVTQGNTTVLNQTGITNKSYTVTGLEAGKTYTFKVKAVPVNTSQATESAWSNVKTVTLPVPTITATPTSLSFGTVNVGENGTASFTVTGENLDGNITASLTDANGVFSLSSNSITPAEAAQGKAITVTYAPNANGNFTGTVTLASSNAQSVTVSLTGTGHVITPTINVSSNALAFDATYVNESSTKKFTVTGEDLSDRVTLTLNDPNGVFSLSQQSVTAAVAMNGTGREITVTFAPTVPGDYSATVTLASTGAQSKTVTLNARAVEHLPALTVSPQSVNFGSVEPDTPTSQTFTINGEYLLGDVTLTLNDENNVFSLSDAVVTKANAEAGKTITVSFQATEEATYTGSITVSTSGMQNITIALSAEVSTGGTASDAYLDIAKYATIDEAGWNHNLVNKLYEYTEHPSDEVAWLTLPMYGAFVGAKYSTTSTTFNSGSPQKWIETNVSAANQCGSTTWTATDVYLGSSNYFTSATAMAVGTNSRNSTAEKSVTFYVTNTTAVRLYASQRSTSTTYPTTLNVYECTVNNDGTLTASSTATQSGSHTASGAGSVSLTGLDETKVYKVVASQARGYLYEIGFQTPLNIPTLTATPTDVSMRAGTNETATATFNVKGKKLSGDVSVSLTDANGVFAVPATVSKANAEAGTDVTVTFNAPATEGTYTGIVTLTSGDLTATVNLTGVCADGGTASDNYLNIAKYATIDEAGATVSGMESIYSYTEYEADDCAWLTLSNYGAMQVDANQNWLTSTSLTRYSNTWNATDIFPGDDAYFGSNSSYDVYGNGNLSFYVTNCTQAKAYVSGSSGYTGTLAVYECTENADGTLTASTTATNTQTGYNGVITSATLDASKIYKVQLTGGGSYPDLLEIGFQTPLTKPKLVANPAELDYIAEPNETVTKTVTVTGMRLTDDVTVTLTDANGVYGVPVNSISMSDATAGYTVSVTLNAPAEEGSYRGVLTFTSGTASAQVGLYGSVGEKGSAFSRYLDIAKYSSLGLNNWYDGIYDKAYKYNDVDYLSDNVAWLTIPATIAYTGWLYNDQNWAGVSSSSNPWWYGHTWNATDVFQGNSYFYGTSEYTFMFGGEESNSTTNTDMYYAIYRVTNCTQVKSYVYNNSGVSGSYPAFIQIYEGTENADGTLTMGDTRIDLQTSSTASTQTTLTSSTLDASKIYFVVVGGYRGFTYEVAFRTPIPTVTLADVAADGNEGQTYRIVDGDIRVVYLSADGKKIYCKDDNAYANPSEIEDGQIDYVRSTAGIMNGDWDQSNWVALQRASGASWTNAQLSLMGHNLKNVRGTLSSKANPVLLIDDTLLPSVADNDGDAVLYLGGTPNVYVTTNFLGGVQEGSDGNSYFFVQPKPMELALVMWAMWDGEKFVVPTSVGQSNQADLGGGFYINPSEYEGEGGVPTLQENHVYNFLGLIKREQPSSNGNGAPLKAGAVSGSYMVYPISGIEDVAQIDGGIITNVNDINAAKGVVEVARYNVAGQRVSKDTYGVVLIKMSDGSVRKVIVE